MKYITPTLIFAISGFLGLFGILLFLESRKAIMDKKDKKANIFGSIFLLIFALIVLSWGVSVWHSSKTTRNTIEEDIGQQAQKDLTKEAAPPVTAQEQPQQDKELKQAQKNTKKQEAEKAVKSFDQVQKTFHNVLTSYQSEIKDISNGTIDTFVYINLDRLSQQALDLFRNAKNMDIAMQYNNEKQIMVIAVLYLQGSIDDLKSYVDDKKISKYTEAQDFLQKAIEANKLVTLGVAKQALIDGYNSSQ
ncbi:MAG: hypothetical protein ACOY40_00415 [Bacillota bacterium]